MTLAVTFLFFIPLKEVLTDSFKPHDLFLVPSDTTTGFVWNRSCSSSSSLIWPQTKRLKQKWNRLMHYSHDVNTESCEWSAWFTAAADCWQFMSWFFPPEFSCLFFPLCRFAGTAAGFCETTLPFCLFKSNFSQFLHFSSEDLKDCKSWHHVIRPKWLKTKKHTSKW